MSLPKFVKMVEVGPRDGLQNESSSVDISTKVEFIRLLSETGLSAIELGSLVRADRVPQMADSDSVFQEVKKISSNQQISYPVLLANDRGLETALTIGVEEIALFTAASESFVQKNINSSIAESLARYKAITLKAKQAGIRVRAYVSCVVGCPYEGEINTDAVFRVTDELLSLGCYEVSLGDTIGIGTPGKISHLLNYLHTRVSIEQLALHCHDTYGQALANVFAGLQAGISVVDSSVAGLGGCPFAPGASGNLASEDLLYMLNGLGIETGVDINKLAAAGNYISSALGRNTQSKVARAMLQSRLKTNKNKTLS